MSLKRIALSSIVAFCAGAAGPSMPAFAQTSGAAEGQCRDAVVRKYGNDYSVDSINSTMAADGRNPQAAGTARNRRGERFNFFCTFEAGNVSLVDLQPAGSRAGSGPGPGRDRDVVCESRNNRRKECRMDTRGGVRLVEQTGDKRCREGSNWGFDRDSVWVDNGCGGRFVSRSGPGGDFDRFERLGNACERAAARSEDFDLRRVKAEDVPRRVSEGVYEFDLRTPRGPYVCTVERDGDVRRIRRR